MSISFILIGVINMNRTDRQYSRLVIARVFIEEPLIGWSPKTKNLVLKYIAELTELDMVK